MSIRNDLLYQENIITQEELAKIINPISDELLDEYGADISLSGYSEVVKEYVSKINSYLEYGNMNKFDKNYEEVEIETPIIRYHKLSEYVLCNEDDENSELIETDINQYNSDGEIVSTKKQKVYMKKVEPYYIDCLADDEGAVAYETTVKTKKYILKEQSKSKGFILSIELLEKLPQEFLSLLKCNISAVINNIERLRNLFFDEKVMTKKVTLTFFNDILDAIEKIKQENKDAYINKQYFNKEAQLKNLPLLKAQYISLYNAYEDLMARQSFFIKKAKHTKGLELDRGL